MKRTQSGFTLIEIAIVLVIIGLLLAGVMKGQELINSAKVKNLAADFKNVPVFIYGYQDKYKALPGDDSAAVAHVSATANGNGDGLIGGGWPATGESLNFWQHVRLAGLAAGPTDTAAPDYIPKNAVGGDLGITSAADSPINSLKGTYVVCSKSIAGKFAKQLDVTLDDSNSATGSLMVADNAATTAAKQNAVATAAIVDDTPYLVCMGF